MRSSSDITFDVMTKHVAVFTTNSRAYLICTNHTIQQPLSVEHIKDGYLECGLCDTRITLEQAKTLINDQLVALSELFDRLDSAALQSCLGLDNDESHS